MNCISPLEGWNFEAFENSVFGKAIFISDNDTKWRMRVSRYLCCNDLCVGCVSVIM
jgi:hypothetical protein